jgi:hypothetical protein
MVFHRSDGATQGQTQRSLPMRQRFEIQEVLRRLRLMPDRTGIAAARGGGVERMRYFSTNARSIR